MAGSIIKSEYFGKSGKLSITLGDAAYINMLWRRYLPHHNFIDTVIDKAKKKYVRSINMKDCYEIDPFEWYGDKLGESVLFFQDSVVPYLAGVATVVFTSVAGDKIYLEIKKKNYVRKYPEIKLVDNPPSAS